MPQGSPRGSELSRQRNALSIDAIVAVKVGDGPGLAEMLDAECAHAVAVDRAQPGQGRRVPVEHRHQRAMQGDHVQQALDVAAGMHKAPFAGALRRGPACIQPISLLHRLMLASQSAVISRTCVHPQALRFFPYRFLNTAGLVDGRGPRVEGNPTRG